MGLRVVNPMHSKVTLEQTQVAQLRNCAAHGKQRALAKIFAGWPKPISDTLKQRESRGTLAVAMANMKKQ